MAKCMSHCDEEVPKVSGAQSFERVCKNRLTWDYACGWQWDDAVSQKNRDLTYGNGVTTMEMAKEMSAGCETESRLDRQGCEDCIGISIFAKSHSNSRLSLGQTLTEEKSFVEQRLRTNCQQLSSRQSGSCTPKHAANIPVCTWPKGFCICGRSFRKTTEEPRC